MRRDGFVLETFANITGLLHVLKEKNLMPRPAADGGVTEKEVKNERKSLRIGSEGAEVLAPQVCSQYAFLLSNIRRRVLRSNLLIDVVRLKASLKEELRRLGFYSGEEYMEFSSFCSGTERAVKDLAVRLFWSRLRLPQRGIMTAELLGILYKQKRTESPGSDAKTDEKGNIPTDLKDATELVSPRLNHSFCNGWTKEQNVHTAMALVLRYERDV
ncbi:hypothetical protein SDJN02_20725, partial [Cucurbita argyrosperma subsp. argyrosperma]